MLNNKARKRARKPPAFQLYPGDFFSSPKVDPMTTEEIGAFLILLMRMWDSGNCSIPDDVETLDELTRLDRSDRSITKRVMRCFVPHPTVPNALTNERLAIEWGIREEFVGKMVANANTRWSRELAGKEKGGTQLQPNGMQSDTNVVQLQSNGTGSQCSSSSSPSSSPPEVEGGNSPETDAAPTSTIDPKKQPAAIGIFKTVFGVYPSNNTVKGQTESDRDTIVKNIDDSQLDAWEAACRKWKKEVTEKNYKNKLNVPACIERYAAVLHNQTSAVSGPTGKVSDCDGNEYTFVQVSTSGEAWECENDTETVFINKATKAILSRKVKGGK